MKEIDRDFIETLIGWVIIGCLIAISSVKLLEWLGGGG